jgi:hypothetical protein
LIRPRKERDVDLARAEAGLNGLSEKRAGERNAANELAEMYAESARRHRERKREENRWEWVRFFDCLAANHARISREYERRVERLLEEPGRGEGGR